MRHILIILMLFSGNLLAADITVRADRSTVMINESFQLVYEASGSVDDDPDFSVLEKDFDILSRSQNSNISIINGDFKRSVTWSLTLVPKQAGIFTLPSISFGKDKSPSLRMTIKPADTRASDSNADQFIEVSSSLPQAYVNQQLIVTVRMFSNSNISQYGLGELVVSGVNADIEKLGEDRQYRSQRGGKTFLVLERSYAVFAQQAGKLQINPLLGEMQLSTGNSQLFDPFRRRGEVKRLRSTAQSIQIKAIPAAFNATNWLAANELQLVEEWPDAKGGEPQFRVGEPVTRRLSLLADGISAERLPPLIQDNVTGIKQYPEQPRLHNDKKASGIIGIREESLALIPAQPGRYTLPAIEIPWWNVKTGQQETLRLAARDIQVTGNVPASNNASQQAAASDVNATSSSPNIPSQPANAVANDQWLWQLLSLLFALAWLATAAGWWWSRRQSATGKVDKSSAHASPGRLDKALQAIQLACQQQSAADCQRALLSWGRLCWQRPDISNLGELGKLCGEPLQTQLLELESVLYSDQHANWDAATLAKQCTHFDCSKTHTVVKTSQLEPLYKA